MTMYFKNITIDNYKCFKHFKVELPERVSLVIGRNGAGKTSLLNSIVYALHFLFTTDKSMGDEYLAAGNPDLKMSSMDYDEFYRSSEKTIPSSDANFHAEMLYENVPLIWDMYKRSTANSSVYPSKYQEAYRTFMDTYKQCDILPVLAFYSDSFPHKESNMSSFAKKQINSFDNVLRNFGYYQWDNENACTQIWQQRLINALLKKATLDDKDDFSIQEATYVENALVEFSKPLHSDCDDAFEIKKLFFAFKADKTPELWLKLKSGKDVKFSSLPAGYLRLYSIVLDLAYRAFLLNRNVAVSPQGLVVIDEIDLHLHPSLAKEVVERFTKLLPNMQFVLTTHSPVVMAGISQADGKNKIFKIIAGTEEAYTDDDVYGIDYNTIMSDYLGIEENDEQLSFLKDSIARLLKMNRLDLVDKRKQELIKLVGKETADKIIRRLSDAKDK